MAPRNRSQGAKTASGAPPPASSTRSKSRNKAPATLTVASGVRKQTSANSLRSNASARRRGEPEQPAEQPAQPAGGVGAPSEEMETIQISDHEEDARQERLLIRLRRDEEIRNLTEKRRPPIEAFQPTPLQNTPQLAPPQVSGYTDPYSAPGELVPSSLQDRFPWVEQKTFLAIWKKTLPPENLVRLTKSFGERSTRTTTGITVSKGLLTSMDDIEPLDQTKDVAQMMAAMLIYRRILVAHILSPLLREELGEAIDAHIHRIYEYAAAYTFSSIRNWFVEKFNRIQNRAEDPSVWGLDPAIDHRILRFLDATSKSTTNASAGRGGSKATEPSNVCRNWNQDRCKTTNCKYLHVCSECNKPDHSAKQHDNPNPPPSGRR